ncbi:MAG TPA: hypothetical protein VEQ60_26800 [Longimicrobium sp.]|nr:hypothetical protein [Longimicrobium sp.]
MKVTHDVAERVRGGVDLGFEVDEDGSAAGDFQSWGEGAYPPPGYLPWNRPEVGNGDTYGFYWPIGREQGPPLVCTIMHDARALVPLASSLAGAVRLHVAAGHDHDGEWAELAGDFGVPLDDVQKRPHQTGVEAGWDDVVGGHAYWGIQSADELLHLDPDSPALLLARAAEHRHPQFLDEAERLLLRALEILPEYTAAWWEFVQIRRRRRAPAAVQIEAMVNCITSPMAFGPLDRSKCLGWLQRLPDSADPENPDPVWRRRGELTFAEGVREHRDHEVFAECIQAYHDQGLHLRAVRLRVVLGEMMEGETISFRERAGFTWPAHWAALRDDLRSAGLDARLPAISGR